MATHYMCHSTEPLPHSYPPTACTGADKKNHGAVSQYEILNMAPKSHTQFTPDWSWSQTSEDDSLPLCQPVPTSKWKQAVPAPGPDPDLCVTPIKTLTGGNKHLMHPVLPDPDLCLTSDNLDLSSLPETEVNLKQNNIPVLCPDPDLSLTPEHFARSRPRSNLRPDCEANIVKEKVQHRVRFDLDAIDNSEYDFSSNIYSHVDPYVNTKSKLTGITVCKHYVPKVYTELQSLDACDDPAVTKTITQTVNNFKESIRPSDSKNIVADKNSISDNVELFDTYSKQPLKQDVVFGLPKRKVVVKREAPVKPALKEYSIPESQCIFDSEPEHVFTRPEFHSTLRMTSEIKQLKESAIDVGKAVKQKLQLTDGAEVEINEKASMKTNTDSATFSELVSLDVPVEDICCRMERKHSAMVKPTKSTKIKQVGTDRREPDIMEFFSRDLQRELADFSQTGIAAPTDNLCTASHELALDIYHHNQVWEDI